MIPGLRFPSRAAAPEQRQQVSATSQSGWSIMRSANVGEFEITGRTVRKQGWERHAVVNACVRVITDLVAAVPLEVYRKTTKGEEVLLNHPALDLLNAPRVGMSAQRLRGAKTAAPFVTYGNAFWLLERPRPRAIPSGIRPIHPERIKYVYTDATTDQIVRWDWQDNSGVVRSAPAEDIVHFPDIDLSEDGYFGFPRAASALIDIVTDAEASQYVRQITKNSGAPTLVVLTEGYAIDDVRNAERTWRERQVERGERGNTRFLNDVKDVKQLGFNLRDLEFPDLRSISREDICAAFNVDPRIIGISSASNDGGLSGTQYREARFRLIQQTVVPIMKAIESVLDLWVMPEFGDVYARFSPDGLAELTEDETATSTRVIAEVQAGVRTREEARKVVGLDEKMTPTDTLIGSISRIEYPVAMQFAHTEPTEDPDPSDDPASPSGDDPDPADEGTRRLRSRVIRRGMTLTNDQRQQLWQHFDTRASREELVYRRTALLLFHSERESIGRLFAEQEQRSAPMQTREAHEDAIIRSVLAHLAQRYAEDGEYSLAWIERYRGLISQTVDVAGSDLAATVGFDFTLENPRVQAAIRNRANKLAGEVTQTTYKQIQSAISAGRAAGMPMRDIADLIDQSVFAGQAPKRAAMIARTETIGALNEGEFVTARESGVMQSKEWLSQMLPNTRESHAAIDGTRVSLGSAFANGLQYPGDQSGDAGEVINCRCTLLYYDEEAEG